MYAQHRVVSRIAEDATPATTPHHDEARARAVGREVFKTLCDLVNALDHPSWASVTVEVQESTDGGQTWVTLATHKEGA